MAIQIQIRRGTAAEWTSANPTLAAGELGVETDTNKLKMGDGTTAWNSLGYTIPNYSLDQLANVTITSAASGEALTWNGSAWVNTDLASSITSALVDSAPATLDTLNEIAAALNDDADFANTISATIATKADASHTHSLVDVTDITATAAELNVLDGITATVTELNYTDGVTSNIQTQLDDKADLTQPIEAKTGAYTLAATDRGDLITCSGTFTITIPSGTFSAGDRVDFINIGTGTITFAGSGVTVNSVDGAVTIDTRWAGATFFFTSSTAGVLVGRLA